MKDVWLPIIDHRLSESVNIFGKRQFYVRCRVISGAIGPFLYPMRILERKIIQKMMNRWIRSLAVPPMQSSLLVVGIAAWLLAQPTLHPFIEIGSFSQLSLWVLRIGKKPHHVNHPSWQLKRLPPPMQQASRPQ